MILKLNGTYSGFSVCGEEKIEEIGGTLYTLSHGSGATLYYVDINDNNKVFGVAFTTPPQDDSGVFHIIEHTVLCGSEKYPVKEPFVNLLKTSMNTFLNAITYPDKTVYPVASTNEKDLSNLMDVYLDAVFNPRITKEPKIFMQEGWHREFDGGNITLNGVVYNEMKGAESPDSVCDDTLFRALFPDSQYRFNAGGEPQDIPNLTYEKYIETYKKHYTPSNAVFFLYGNLDFEKKTEQISGYLSGAKKTEPIKLAYQLPVDRRLEADYDCDEMTDDNTYIQTGYVPYDVSDIEKLTALSLIDDALCSSNQSPLKKAVMDAGLGVDFESGFDINMLQPVYKLKISKTRAQNEESFKKAIDDTVLSLIKNGIPKDELRASLSRMEFNLREDDCGSRPRGVYMLLRILSSTLYGGKPEKWLRFEKINQFLQSKIDTDYFENILKEVFFDTKHKATVIINPVKNLTEKRDKFLKKQLADYKASLLSNEVSKLKAETKQFKEYQSAPDSPENLAKLPTLTIDDIDDKPPSTQTTATKKDGIKLLRHNVFSRGITYVRMYFNLDGLSGKELSYAGMLAGMLDELPAAGKSPADIKRIIKRDLGEWSASARVFSQPNGKYIPLFCVSYSALRNKLPVAVRLTDDILTSAEFASDIIKTVTLQGIEVIKESMRQSGHITAMKKLRARLSSGGKAGEALGGSDYYFLMRKEIKDEHALAKKLETIAKKIFTRSRLTVSLTTDDISAEEEVLSSRIPQGDGFTETQIERDTASEAFIIPGNINYTAAGVNLEDIDCVYDSRLHVVSRVLDYGYLWNEVRAKGGAYGTGLSPSRTGEIIFYSYRDPNISETVDIFKQSGQFLKNSSFSKEEIDGYIISIIGDLDKPVSPRLEGLNADAEYFTNYSKEEKENARKRIMTTAPKDISDFAELFSKISDHLLTSAAGNKEKINAFGFDKTRKL